jgi:hypothetical protein
LWFNFDGFTRTIPPIETPELPPERETLGGIAVPARQDPAVVVN